MLDERGNAARVAERERSMSSRERSATLYVFPGSHPCKSAMLMLDRKAIPYRRVNLVPGLHPLSVRIRGFPGNRTPIRRVDGRTHRSLGLLDRIGTVPALRLGGEKIQTNREIARFLERTHPEPPLFPREGARRRAVEEAERWGDEVLQMAARRIVLAAALRGVEEFRDRGSRGRLGPLMSENETVRVVASRMSARIFRATDSSERELLAALPAMLDSIDAWIAEGVLDAGDLNAADLMIAPSPALLAYRRDLRPEIEARAAGALLERVLPEPEAT
jgi:glutathione S-transferase